METFRIISMLYNTKDWKYSPKNYNNYNNYITYMYDGKGKSGKCRSYINPLTHGRFSDPYSKGSEWG